MIRIETNVKASPPSIEYQFLRVPACRISPARLVENHTQTPNAMNAPEATIVLCQSVPPDRLTPAACAFWMKKWYVSARWVNGFAYVLYELMKLERDVVSSVSAAATNPML